MMKGTSNRKFLNEAMFCKNKLHSMEILVNKGKNL